MATSNLDKYVRGRLPDLPESKDKYLQEELRKLERQSATTYEKVVLTDENVSGLSAEIATERTVRAAQTEALAQQIETISVTSSRQSTFYQTTAPQGSIQGDIWIDSDDGNKLYTYNNGAWVLVDNAQLAQNAAAITTEQTARINGDSSLASQINTVSATASRLRVFRQGTAPSSPVLGDLWIDTNDNNRFKYWSGSAWVISDDLRVAVNAAAITTEQTARADADSALSTQITNLSASTTTGLGNLSAQIATESTARTNADSTLASQITTVSAAASSAQSTADSAAAAAATNTAAITNEVTARANADSALATQINTLTSTVSGNSTSISTLQSSVNGVTGRYGVTINNNGHISGISLLSDASNGAPTSVFRISAEQFAIRTPGALQDSVYWDSGTAKLIVRGDIEATSVVDNAVGTNAIQVNAVGTNKIQANAVTVPGGVSLSSNFVRRNGGGVTPPSSYYVMGVPTFSSDGQPLLIFVSCSVSGYYELATFDSAAIVVKVNGSNVMRGHFRLGTSSEPIYTIVNKNIYIPAPPTGNISIEVYLEATGFANATLYSEFAGGTNLVALGLKR